MSSSKSVSVKSQIREIDVRLSDISQKIAALTEEKQMLLAQKESLRDLSLLEKTKNRSSENWSGSNFPWSKHLMDILPSKFKIKELRSLQLEAINATMSKQDVILIMPTGGGKSLCYQLPALLSDGVTLVVSPLVALMEDQVAGLRRLGIEAALLSANSSKEDAKKVSNALTETSSKIKLLYATPERLAKSKRFMNQLQKCAANGRFARLAIDEVHCCSTWGHDFRPDYNYLGVLKDMFPNTPIIGLTATSTSKVTIDVQKMLGLEGALVLRAPFNRPNLHYSVLQKPDQKEACVDLIADWIKGRFRGQTGIIYTTTIKDCGDLANDLKARGIKVGVYHAVLEPDVRSRVYERWMEGSYQVVVATVAFGLGIDKPDVRFVIHHAMSKSMEMLYQESGRAGRDGKSGHCVVLYRLADVFKLSTMVFTQRTGLVNLYGIVQYCLEARRCRRNIVAEYFDEVFESDQCNAMCDHCCAPGNYKQMDVASYCRSFYQILDHASGQDRQLTAIKLIDSWLQVGDTKLRLKSVKVPTLDRTRAEVVVAILLCKSYLKEDFHYTAYSTISYLKKGPNARLLEDKNHVISIDVTKLANDIPVRKKDSQASLSQSINYHKKQEITSKKIDEATVSDDDEEIISPVKKKKAKLELFGSESD